MSNEIIKTVATPEDKRYYCARVLEMHDNIVNQETLDDFHRKFESAVGNDDSKALERVLDQCILMRLDYLDTLKRGQSNRTNEINQTHTQDVKQGGATC